MATQAQINANRRNAEKSTGPITPEGKAAVSRNALRHGLRARVMAPGPEDNAAFTNLCADLEAAWHPLDQPEFIQVEAMAVAYWKLARIEADAAVYLQTIAPMKRLPFEAQLAQVQSRLERAYSRAQRDLERLQKTRALRGIQLAAPVQAPAVQPATPNPAEPAPRYDSAVLPDLAFSAAPPASPAIAEPQP